MSTHVMLDLETMGIGNEAAIIALGAVKFDPAGDGIDDAFYVRVDLESTLAAGMKVDGSTVMWWLHEDRADARKALSSTDAQHFDDALHGFREWFGPESVPVWGNGAAFDNVILRNAYAKTWMTCPWRYADDRCYRTLKSFRPELEIERSGTHHQAYDDAVSQAKHLQAIIRDLGISW